MFLEIGSLLSDEREGCENTSADVCAWRTDVAYVQGVVRQCIQGVRNHLKYLAFSSKQYSEKFVGKVRVLSLEWRATCLRLASPAVKHLSEN